MRFLEVATETVTTRYFHTDHLGSVAVITNEAGGVVERLSHDAWGKRRFPNGADDPTGGSIASLTTVGFTGQEELSKRVELYQLCLSRRPDYASMGRAVWTHWVESRGNKSRPHVSRHAKRIPIGALHSVC